MSIAICVGVNISFSQESYTVVEGSGEVNVCAQIADGTVDSSLSITFNRTDLGTASCESVETCSQYNTVHL